MKYGVAVRVKAKDLATVRTANSLIIRAMADGEGRPHHIEVEDDRGRTVVLRPLHYGDAVGGFREAENFCLKGVALAALKAFLKAHPSEEVEVYFGPDSFGEDHLAFTAFDGVGEGYDRLKFWESGIFSLTSYWGSQDYWDQWVIDPRSGEVTYTGTVDESRLPPHWFQEALDD